jgi:alpha-tubulin suppressor-like RCC1 family protein
MRGNAHPGGVRVEPRLRASGLLTLAFALLGASCGSASTQAQDASVGDAPEPSPDAAEASPADASLADATADALSDAADSAADAHADVTLDAFVDGPADAPPDAAADAPVDAAAPEQDAPFTDSSAGDSADGGFAGDAGACVTAIGNGAEYSCAVLGDSSLWCWGRNDYGQVGDGSYYNQTTPQHITGVPPIRAVATGIDSACALATDGSVLCWGRNSSAEVGNGNEVPQRTPVVTIPSGVTALATGYTETMCAIKSDGSLWCWGNDSAGQCGGPPTAFGNVYAPQKVDGLPGAVVAAAVGGPTCAILSDSTLWCWGDNSTWSLGYSLDAGESTQTPHQVVALGTGVVKVAAGGGDVCAVKSDGTLWCWGNNTYGQLGPEVDGGIGTPTPTRVVAAGNDVVDVSACENTCVRKADGSVWCWGNNGEYQSGFVGPSSAVPTLVVGVSGATALVSGVWNSCAITAGGIMKCWGTNGAGELGIGSYSSQTATPTAPLLACP